MRVLLVGPVPPQLGSRNPGGVARHTWDLTRALREAGHDVDLLATGRYFQRTRTLGGITVWGSDFSPAGVVGALKVARAVSVTSRSWSLRERCYLLYTAYRLASLPEPERYDVVHAHGTAHKAPVAWQGLDLGPPVVVTVHSYSEIAFAPSGDRRRLVQHRTDVYRHADLLIHVSETDRRKGLRHGVRWQCADRVVHHGLDEAGGMSAGAVRRSGICFVGTLSDRKGLPSLLDAWARISTEVAGPLRIAGEGPLEAEVASVADAHQSVEYLGYLDRDELRELLERSWVLVVPSRSESFGLSYAEALTVGTSVVGYRDILEEFKRILECTERERRMIVPVAVGRVDSDELAALIERAFRQRRAEEMSEVAARLAGKARKYFSWQRAIYEIEEVYRRVIG